MAKNKRNLVRLTDLFVQGRTVTLPDGTNLWVQALNPFERDEAFSDATVARSRIVLALKAEGSERIKCAARLAEHGRDTVIDEIAELRSTNKLADLAAEIRDDPEWTERLAIVERTDFTSTAKPATEAEIALLSQINTDFFAELTTRQKDERDFQQRTLSQLSDEELIDEYATEWLDKHGGELANAEYSLTEVWYATRWCDATEVPGASGEAAYNHAPCGGHGERVFSSKAEARMAPEELFDLLREALLELSMGARDPKGSGSAVSSSDSSATPSAPEASTPSI